MIKPPGFVKKRDSIKGTRKCQGPEAGACLSCQGTTNTKVQRSGVSDGKSGGNEMIELVRVKSGPGRSSLCKCPGRPLESLKQGCDITCLAFLADTVGKVETKWKQGDQTQELGHHWDSPGSVEHCGPFLCAKHFASIIVAPFSLSTRLVFKRWL